MFPQLTMKNYGQKDKKDMKDDEQGEKKLLATSRNVIFQTGSCSWGFLSNDDETPTSQWVLLNLFSIFFFFFLGTPPWETEKLPEAEPNFCQTNVSCSAAQFCSGRPLSAELTFAEADFQKWKIISYILIGFLFFLRKVMAMSFELAFIMLLIVFILQIQFSH